jgi:hypothetical protein
MTSRAVTKVLTVGRTAIGERTWSAAKCLVSGLPRTLRHLLCVMKTFFVALTAPSRTVGLARHLYDERGGVESTHGNMQRRPFRSPGMGSGSPVPQCHPTGHPSMRTFMVIEE